MTEDRAPTRQRDRLEAAFQAEERDGIRLASRVRLFVLAVIGIWISVSNPFSETLYYLVLLAAFALLGLAWLWLTSAGLYRRWQSYVFVFADMALMTFTLLVPNPFDHVDTPALLFDVGNFPYFMILVAASAFAYSPALVIWGGVSAALTWGLGALWVAQHPETITYADLPANLSTDEIHAWAHEPRFLDSTRVIRDVIVVILTAVTLAAAVWRARRVVLRQAESERQRANLARYFSPNMVDTLAGSDGGLGEIARKPVAILFADIRGFTHLCEASPPEQVIELLRAFHGIAEDCVFRHEGTIDKYIGDGVMACFGTPATGLRDCANAVACARCLHSEVARWNAGRAGSMEPVRIGIGIHYGPVVLGDVGGIRRLEFTAIGDAVNVAARLEEATRDLDVDVVVSDELAAQARAQDGDGALDGFVAGATLTVRGRQGPLRIWTWRGTEADAPAGAA